jgi:signal transduction histidine kinase
MEDALIVSILVSGILNLIMGVLIVSGANDKKKSLPFALFSFSTFLVALSYFATHKTGYSDSVRWSYAFGVLIPTFLLAWVFNYASANFKTWKTVAIYISGAIFFTLPFAGKLLITGITKDEHFGFIEQTGVMYPVYIAYFLFVYGLVMFKLINVYKNRPEEKKQARLILTGFAMYGGLGILFGLVLPFFGYDRLTDFDIPSSVIFVAFTTYAIVEYRWMNIKVIAVQMLSALILGVALFEIFIAGTKYLQIYKTFIFIIYSALSFFMVKSVINEVRRKEELQIMSDKLAKANDKLRMLDNEKTDFLSIASHQIRTPLTAVKGFISLALEGSFGELNDKLRDALQKVYANNERVVNLVEDLLNISRIESGRMEFNFSKWSMENICQEVVDTLALKAKDRGLFLEYIMPGKPLPEITTDGPKVKEVVSNLVDNAVKYTPKGGVTVTLDESENIIRVTVSDTGIGIPSSELPYLFTKFSRGKDTSRLNTGGTGLGLYVCKSIIDNVGGNIWAESEGKEKGSHFILEIPINK